MAAQLRVTNHRKTPLGATYREGIVGNRPSWIARQLRFLLLRLEFLLVGLVQSKKAMRSNTGSTKS